MKANRVHRFGPPEVIVFEDVPEPVPGEGQVLVRVKAAGVGAWDAWVRAGKSVLPQPLPFTLGSDFSGVVTAVGPGVEGRKPGDLVYGATNARFTDAYAEYTLASAKMIADKPRSIGHVEAASMPVVAVTAYQMLFDDAEIVAGQTVLVHGGAGNVGAYAVQLAHRFGARVIATAKTEGIADVRRFGADQVIDVRTTRFEDIAGKVDAVIDTVGGEVQERSFAVLARGGILVSAVSEPDARLAEQLGVRAKFMLVEVTTARLADLAARVDAGKLSIRVGSVVPLADARKAHEMLEGKIPRLPGRIVLDAG
ncbi:zinc-containing alcohol dehydrogenase [Minicystis rosea]|nr:zinc-containing alcohol dehydrogenase [Minicystis rosea]